MAPTQGSMSSLPKRLSWMTVHVNLVNKNKVIIKSKEKTKIKDCGAILQQLLSVILKTS